MPDKINNRILIIFAHPAIQKSRINLELFKTVSSMDGVTLRDIYETYPDFLINVKDEQKLLLDHDIIVLQHPFYWYSSPAIIKEWIDRVLEYGFAYGHDGTALAGKSMMSAITAGGSEDSYKADGVHYYNVRDFLRPFERTAALCGMKYLPPFVVHHTPNVTSSHEISSFANLYREVIIMLRDNEFDPKLIAEYRYVNDYVLSKRDSQAVD